MRLLTRRQEAEANYLIAKEKPEFVLWFRLLDAQPIPGAEPNAAVPVVLYPVIWTFNKV
jgi:hypothetical protein